MATFTLAAPKAVSFQFQWATSGVYLNAGDPFYLLKDNANGTRDVLATFVMPTNIPDASNKFWLPVVLPAGDYTTGSDANRVKIHGGANYGYNVTPLDFIVSA